jgi:hypothetical protein
MKRRSELRDLSDDHHTGLVLALRCKRTAQGTSGFSVADTWRQVQEAFTQHIEPHFGIEERYLLPALEALGEASMASRVRDGHAALREASAGGPPADRLVVEFGELLERQIRFEEREVFDKTQDRLPRGVLDAIAEACETHPRVCPTSLLSP